MKQFIFKPATLFLFLVIFLAACTKTDIPVPPPDTDPQPVSKGQVRFSMSMDLSGQPYHSSNLQAVAELRNAQDQVIEKTLLLQLQNPVLSETFELPAGQYRLTGLRLLYGGTNAHFAAPLSGSAKASLVQQPLAITFSVAANQVRTQPVEVVKIQATDKPLDYGYPSGAFDNGQADADPFLKVKLRAVMQIGEVVYDSIPASLTLSTFNAAGEMTTSYFSLAAGINEIPVAKSAARYEFDVRKWGVSDKISINRNEFDENTVYVLGGSKAAKKLKSERVYKLVNGVEKAVSKNDYFYDAGGKLLKIEYWSRKADFTAYLSMVDEFEYQSGRVSRIERTDKETGLVTSLSVFSYNGQEKLAGMTRNEGGNQTTAELQYLSGNNDEISIKYDFSFLTYNMSHTMGLLRGNVQSSAVTTTHGNYENGLMEHDLNINPYVHINFPKLLPEHISKNNLKRSYKTFQGSYPAQGDPYQFDYTYDSEGYPVEVTTHYKTFQYGTPNYTTRTVFVY